MKKSIRLKNLECANCASKLERSVSKLEGVVEVSVNFLSQKMILEVAEENLEYVLEAAKKIAKKIEPDMEICA